MDTHSSFSKNIDSFYDKVNKLSSTRLICSDENQNEFLDDFYKNNHIQYLIKNIDLYI